MQQEEIFNDGNVILLMTWQIPEKAFIVSSTLYLMIGGETDPRPVRKAPVHSLFSDTRKL